jgi:hypothetical protein
MPRCSRSHPCALLLGVAPDAIAQAPVPRVRGAAITNLTGTLDWLRGKITPEFTSIVMIPPPGFYDHPAEQFTLERTRVVNSRSRCCGGT